MAKFYGNVGYIVTTENEDKLWIEEETTRPYTGDFLRVSSNWENSGNLNDNINLSNRISIIGDPFAYEHFSAMRFVEFGGTKWKINSVEVSSPRLILSVGGVYNGND